MMLLLMMSMGNTDTAEPPSTALTPDGNLTLVDDYDEAHADGSGKQFITLVTKAGIPSTSSSTGMTRGSRPSTS